MSLSTDFNPNASSPAFGPNQHAKRPAPFSIRLSEPERARLLLEAAGAPLGAYIKAKVLGTTVPLRVRRSGLAVEDRKLLAQGLAFLGNSRLASNLNQLAKLANTGALPMTPETEAELAAALLAVQELRRLFLLALGMKPEVVS